MTVGKKPAVFLSSTCYDLKQIRIDIKTFIEQQLGFDATLSEYNSFPVDPNINTIDNCIRTVKEHADIFVLVIGGRYGSITQTGKSITNLEYSYAKTKGIPIYAFVDKSILNVLPIWEANPTADFSKIVDTPKLFEFIKELRGKDNIWVYSFESAQDIIQTLTKQLSFLMSDCLAIRRQIYSLNLSDKLKRIDGNSIKIILEKPSGWEFLLFGNIIKDNLKKREDMIRDLKYGISFGISKNFSSIENILSWLGEKVEEILITSNTLLALFNDIIPIAMGQPGEEGDIDYIIYAGERFGQIYEEFIKWGLDFKRILVEKEWQPLVNSLAKVCESPINDLDEYITKYFKEMEKIALIDEENQEQIELDLNCTLSSPDLKDYYIELDIIAKKYNLNLS